jgi:hypothetical protein
VAETVTVFQGQLFDVVGIEPVPLNFHHLRLFLRS